MIGDRIVYTLSRRWLLFANLALALYVGLPLLAPMLMQAGLEAPARALYTVYSPFCHQMASRSFFLFGEQPAYPRQISGTELTPIETYMGDIPAFENASADPVQWATFILPARQFVGNEQLGYKTALCQRDMSIYAAMLAFGLLYGLLRRRVNIRPMPFWLFLLIGLLPIALDGFSQLFSQFIVGFDATGSLSQLLPLRESTPFLRTLTGALFGFSLAWLIIPRIDSEMTHIADVHAAKLAHYDSAEGVLPG